VAAPAEVLGALRYRLPEGLVVQLGGGLGVTKGYGAADSRILASVVFEPVGGAKEPIPARDPREKEEQVEWEWDLE